MMFVESFLIIERVRGLAISPLNLSYTLTGRSQTSTVQKVSPGEAIGEKIAYHESKIP
jgi:hypothetical protein